MRIGRSPRRAGFGTPITNAAWLVSVPGKMLGPINLAARGHPYASPVVSSAPFGPAGEAKEANFMAIAQVPISCEVTK